jgi:hypothetical protein
MSRRCSDDDLYALHDDVFFRLVRSEMGTFARTIAMACLDNIKTVLHARGTMRYTCLPACG